ncbi:hypothetical protein FXO38_36859 [Capsicum annuum]|nr:hypothetical protein FXO38_36859 [Capsicum annuum]
MVATRSSLARRVIRHQLASSSSTIKVHNKRSRKFKKRGPDGNTPTSTIAPIQVPPPWGSTSSRPLEVPSDEEEKQRESKLNLNPLSRLEALKQTVHTKSYPQMNEQSKNMIINVRSWLVSTLTSGTTTNVDDMVTFAVGAFTMLNGLGVDDHCFYRDVTDLISKKYDLQMEKRKRDVLSFSELENKYEEVVILVDDLQENIKHIRGELKEEMEKMEPLKRDIEEAEEELRRKKKVVATIESDVESLKLNEEKCKAYLTNAHAKVEKLGTQVEAAKTAKEEIEQRKIIALQEIESISRRLLSTL